MKKSKIIIPALGIIILSTAASVSGTVAWFTSNRVFTSGQMQFGVARLDGDLTCKMTNINGVTPSSANYETNSYVTLGVSGDKNTTLLDASYTVTADTVFTDVPADSGQPTAYESKGAALSTNANLKVAQASSSDGNDHYYAVSWDMEFKYANPDGSGASLFFDPSASQIAEASGSDRADGKTYDNTLTTAKGFRMAFIPKDANGKKIVWAGLSDLASSTASRVTSASASAAFDTAVTYYNAANTHVSTGAGVVSKIDNGTLATHQAAAQYLGAFNTTTDVCTVTAVAWFEGMDTNVVNEAYLRAVQTVALSFYVRNVKTA